MPGEQLYYPHEHNVFHEDCVAQGDRVHLHSVSRNGRCNAGSQEMGEALRGNGAFVLLDGGAPGCLAAS